ncbi:MAG: trypsin-like peptidase domain-containing protein [Phycisphaerales bacterium]
MTSTGPESGERIYVDLLSGFASPWTGEFTKDRITIGRAQDADVRLHPTKDTVSASRIHCTLVRDGGCLRLTVEHDNGVTVELSGQSSRFFSKGQSIELPGAFELTIGKNGPRIAVHTTGGDLPGTLQGTLAQRRQAATMPVAHVTRSDVKAARGGRTIAIVVALALLLLGSAGAYVAYRTAGDVGTLKKLREEDLAGIFAEQKRTQVALAKKPPTEALREALRAAADSVLLVGVRDKEGFTPLGTAWTGAPGVLVTNAHVAVALRAKLKDAGEGSAVIARRGPALEGELLIGAIEDHPAFEPWNELLAGQVVRAGQQLESANLVPVCDVALLRVMSGEAGKPLKLAEAGGGASPGDPIGYAGFPTEGIAGLPALQTLTGSVSAVTDFFCRAAPTTTDPDGLLIHHNAVSTGGASGSPLINERGEVVGLVCAGSMLAVGDLASGAVRRVSVGVNYGQSVSLVRELLSGKAAEAQKARDGAWRDRMAGLFVSPADRLAAQLADLQKRLGVTLETVTESTATLSRAGVESVPPSLRRALTLDAGYHYFLLAAASDWSDLTLAVVDSPAGSLMELARSERTVAMVAVKADGSPRAAEVVLTALNTRAESPQGLLRIVRVKD